MPSSRRWLTLGVYSLVVALSQLLWLNFAPLLSMIQSRYGVSELLASALVLVFPALYVVFSLPAGALVDARGYRFTVGAGAALMAAAACVRIFDGSFWTLFAGQLGIAVAQPFIVNGISKLVSDWFRDDEGAIATGLGTMGMFLGMAAGMAATPALVAAVGLRATMAIFAAISIAVAIVFVAVVHPNSARVADDAATSDAAPARLGGAPLVTLFVLAFLGLGVFNGLTTWLEGILAPHGFDAERAGLVGGALIVAGIAGAVVIPALSDRARRRRPFLILCAAMALATIHPLCTSDRAAVVFIAAALHGFFFMPAFALLLEMCAQLSGLANAGRATSILMMAGNAGGVVVIVAMPLVKGAAPDFHRAVLLLVALLAATTALALTAPETSRR
ncbi:MAG: transporter [Myxococcales bacterium]|nr:transporter [Myxococcales bacterium]